MKKCIVLGGGMVGSVMACDLAAGMDVTVADIREESLKKCAERAEKMGRRVGGVKADLSDLRAVHGLVKGYDLVCGAVASGIAYGVMEAVIEARKDYADISFMPEDADKADSLAKKHGVTVVTDFGVAPGMSHVLAARCMGIMDSCENIEIYVGGLPRRPEWPFLYKAAFSPADVIEEYTRESRVVEHGRVVMKEALSEPEIMDFGPAGKLEAFNTDGLRSLARTHLGKVANMKEKTLRYPGHIELMRVLRHVGLMGEEEIHIANGKSQMVNVRPRDVLAKLLFPLWTYEPGEEDLTVMRVIGEGKKGGKGWRVQWDLFDVYDQGTQATSMARTTAFPCACAARMLGDGALKGAGVGPGVVNPEVLGKHQGIVERLLREQGERGIRYGVLESAA